MKKKTYIQPSFATYHFAIRPLLDVSIRKYDNEPAEKINNNDQPTSGSTIWGDYWGGGDAM